MGSSALLGRDLLEQLEYHVCTVSHALMIAPTTPLHIPNLFADVDIEWGNNNSSLGPYRRGINVCTVLCGVWLRQIC
jgi:hypothetical protein